MYCQILLQGSIRFPLKKQLLRLLLGATRRGYEAPLQEGMGFCCVFTMLGRSEKWGEVTWHSSKGWPAPSQRSRATLCTHVELLQEVTFCISELLYTAGTQCRPTPYRRGERHVVAMSSHSEKQLMQLQSYPCTCVGGAPLEV